MTLAQRTSYYEADARARIAGLIDAGSFREFLGPARRAISPHLAQLDQPAAFDDGIVVGEGRLRGKRVLVAAHGNSIRSLIMAIEGLTPEEILKRELDTGVPVVYHLGADSRPLSVEVLA